MAEQHVSRTAPFHTIPSRRIVSVEHPAIIKNVDKAIDTLQGNQGVSKILHPLKHDSPINMYIRPDDPMARPIQSISSASNNILLKVTVPKRTGRKRKRGTNDPFTGIPITTSSAGPQRHSAKELLQTLRDNEDKYQIEPVGLVNRTHVFRAMPDFVFSLSSSSFASRFREQVLSYDYEKMKQFDLDMSKGAFANVDIIPPPSFSHGDMPFSYMYRQNPTVKQSIDTTGKVTTINTQQAMKVRTHLVPYDISPVPSAPHHNCPPLDEQEKTLRETVTAITTLFEERPLWTRRGLRNCLPSLEQRYTLRFAIPYVGYIFRSGPWRDAIVKFGHDPRTSPEYRIYQTVMFRGVRGEPEPPYPRRRNGHRPGTSIVDDDVNPLPNDDEGAGGPGADVTIVDPTAPNSNSSQRKTHIFTGQPPLPRDGRMWMYCDITDPLLRGIIFPPSGDITAPPADGFLRDTCDIVSDGWYGAGTVAKLKTIMRHKILANEEDRVPDDGEFMRLLDLPDHVGPGTLVGSFSFESATATSGEMQLATEVRSTIKGSQTWREMNAAVARGVEGGKKGKGKGKAKDAGGRRVQWEDGVEGGEDEYEEDEEGDVEEDESEAAESEESEGEEEALEQAEMAAAAVDAIEEGQKEQDEQV